MADVDAAGDTRRARLWESAAARQVPLAAIMTTIGLAVAVYLAGRLVYKLREVIVLLLVAGFIALLLNPLVVLLGRWGVRRRGAGVAIVVVMALLVFAGLATAFGYPLVNAIGNLSRKLPSYVDQARHGKGWIGHLVVKYHVQHWVQQNAPKLSNLARNLSKPALTLGKGAVSATIALFAVFMLVVLLLLEGPKLRHGILSLFSPAHRTRIIRVAREVNRSVTGYMFGNFITSMIAGVVVFVTLLVLGVPYALLWALWVGLVDFLPMIGGALAGVPTVLFALTHSLAAGIVTAVVFVVYTQVENHVLNPVVMSRTVRINPLLVLIAILVGANVGSLVGGAFGGFVAILLAVPLAAAIQVVVRELWRSSEPDPPGPADVVTGPGPFDAQAVGGGAAGSDAGLIS